MVEIPGDPQASQGDWQAWEEGGGLESKTQLAERSPALIVKVDLSHAVTSRIARICQICSALSKSSGAGGIVFDT